MADHVTAGEDKEDRLIVTPEESNATLWSRRGFFFLAGGGGGGTGAGGGVLGFGGLLSPRVLWEPLAVFKAGLPEEYPIGTVSERWKQEERVWIVHEPDGFYALSAICTHLGCTPNWLNAEDKFKCPCHGSGFRRTGVNFEGPAPRPLERVKIALSDDGQLVIDKSVQFRFERGDWTRPGAFLKLKV